MKKRIIAAFISVVIVALSVLIAFSGCSGEESVKEVENRDELFSKIAGVYISEFQNIIYINNDATFYVYLCDSVSFIQLKGSFKKIYQDSEFKYHSDISKLEGSFSLTERVGYPNTFNFEQGVDSIIHSISYFGNIIGQNDILYIYAPGEPSDDIPESYRSGTNIIGAIVHSGEKLDDYILCDYTKQLFYTPPDSVYPINNNYNYVEEGSWVCYNSDDSKADVYRFNEYKVEVTSCDYSDNSDNIEMSVPKENEPLFYTTFKNNVFMIYKNDKIVILNSTDDRDILKCTVKEPNEPKDKIFYLYHYNGVLDKEEMKKDAAKAKAAFTDENK